MLAVIVGVLAVAVGACWLALGVWAFRKAQATFEKYSKYRKLENLDPKFNAFYRDDYANWDHFRIKIGCLTILPFRIISFISLVIGGLFFVFLLNATNFHTIVVKLFTLYLNTYGRVVIRIMCRVE
jgi:hypothetical protein